MQKDHPPPTMPQNETPFQRFQRLAKKIVAAPKGQPKDRDLPSA